MLCICAKRFLIHSISSFKNTSLILEPSYPSGRLLATLNLTAILITRMEHQRRPLSKENTIERKHRFTRFPSFSLPNPCVNRSKVALILKALCTASHHCRNTGRRTCYFVSTILAWVT